MISECLQKSWYAFFGNPRERKIGHYGNIWNLSLSRWVFHQASFFFSGWRAMLVYQRVSSDVAGEWSMSSSETTKMPQQKMFESCRHKGAGG